MVGKAKFMQDWIHEITGSISGEGASGSVGPMGAGREAKDEDTGTEIAEAGDGTGPVSVVLVRPAPGFADAGAVIAQTGTKLAGDDGIANGVAVQSVELRARQCFARRRAWRLRWNGFAGRDGFHGKRMAAVAKLTHTAAM